MNFFKKHPIITTIASLFIILIILSSFSDNNQTVQSDNQIIQSPQKNFDKAESGINQNAIEKEVNNWQYDTSVDKMRNIKRVIAINLSTNTLDLGFPYNDSQMSVGVRREGLEEDIIISVKGQFSCSPIEKCYISVKADDSPIEDYEFTKAAHSVSNTIFIKDKTEFLNMLKVSKKLIIEAPLFNQGNPQYEFDVSGLKWE